ncbi:MAG: peptidoglycan DD-metalloendopeptidase family protein [Fibrobacteria bacterium]
MIPRKIRPNSLKHRPRRLAIAGLGCLAGLAILGGCRQQSASVQAEVKAPAPQIVLDTLSGRVKTGQSFNSIVHDLALPAPESSRLLSGIKENFRFKLYAGQAYQVIFQVTEAGKLLQGFNLEDRNCERRHVLALPGFVSKAKAAGTVPTVSASVALAAPGAINGGPSDAFAYALADIPVRMDTISVNGTLNSSLYEAFLSRGENGALIQQVTKIFAWDLDFFKDPRVGDEFSLLVEKRFGEDGSFRGYGKVLSAKYVNRGRDYFGILYKGAYYTQDGRSMEKMLMKAPLNYVHVSSGFSAARLHPVLGITRPHWGIDYCGPKNTKILAAGDGTVEYSKWVNGYGNTIKIRHNGVYNTYYAHLNGYAAGLRAGNRVKQGDLIGYMGMTGLASGVHLDYRVEFNGKYINPASLKMEAKQGVDKLEWKEFCSRRDQLLTRMSAPELKHFASVVPAPSEQATKAF